MKNVLLILAMILSNVLWASDIQTSLQEKKAEYYAAEAVKHFKLKDSKKQAIYEAKLALIQAQKEMADKNKSGEIKKSEMEQYRKKNVYPHTKAVMDAIGVQWDKLEPFNDRVHPIMNKMTM
ncbi:hypothetical protein SAMN06295967_110121 [Belliella buryatensis]|uniref:EF-hand domain-containing protein n=1 Tax=Belliella buryatensis TaxID=1500549 RepID=A0A239EW04_9BACT|nr:hypothetical protein [Belliella buryatensis]SNS48082.1 hypothetical protein SAMN06295967_110121 [Belliella buryatensis]